MVEPRALRVAGAPHALGGDYQRRILRRLKMPREPPDVFVGRGLLYAHEETPRLRCDGLQRVGPVAYLRIERRHLVVPLQQRGALPYQRAYPDFVRVARVYAPPHLRRPVLRGAYHRVDEPLEYQHRVLALAARSLLRLVEEYAAEDGRHGLREGREFVLIFREYDGPPLRGVGLKERLHVGDVGPALHERRRVLERAAEVFEVVGEDYSGGRYPFAALAHHAQHRGELRELDRKRGDAENFELRLARGLRRVAEYAVRRRGDAVLRGEQYVYVRRELVGLARVPHACLLERGAQLRGLRAPRERRVSVLAGLRTAQPVEGDLAPEIY